MDASGEFLRGDPCDLIGRLPVGGQGRTRVGADVTAIAGDHGDIVGNPKATLGARLVDALCLGIGGDEDPDLLPMGKGLLDRLAVEEFATALSTASTGKRRADDEGTRCFLARLLELIPPGALAVCAQEDVAWPGDTTDDLKPVCLEVLNRLPRPEPVVGVDV